MHQQQRQQQHSSASAARPATMQDQRYLKMLVAVLDCLPTYMQQHKNHYSGTKQEQQTCR
jgi:hypothetical protein